MMTLNITNNKLIKLEAGQLILYVNKSFGGAIVAAYYHDKAFLRSNIKAKEPRESSCFVMAPFCGWLPNKGFNWADQQYNPESNLVKNKPAVHGYAWQNDMQVISQKENKLVLKYHFSKTTDWPWSFDVEQTFLLDNENVEITLKVTNQATVNAPVALGLHPYFNLNKNSSIRITTQGQALPLYKSFGNLEDECETLMNWCGSLCVEQKHMCIYMHAEADTKLYLGIYRPANADYICLEPISQQLNCLDLSDNILGFDSVTAGSSRFIKLTLSPKLLNA